VRSYTEKLAAEKAARRVAGVFSVADALEVRLPGSLARDDRDDTDIAEAVAATIKWNASVPRTVKAKVEDGLITLDGDVEWEFQRRAAEKVVRGIAGVRGVINRLKVRQRITAENVEQRIHDAFRRSAQIDADHVRVGITGGKVTLTGTVRSWAERMEAQYAAWAAPGVTEVVNNIEVRSALVTA
jgi:osmotically-inducible protein OsmY